MSVITKDFSKKERLVSPIQSSFLKRLWHSYVAYAERQKDASIIWYMKVIIAIPCVIMVPTIFLMAMATPNYIWFIGLSMLLFFVNVVAFIAETKSTLFVPLYHATILIMILIPLITYYINL